MGEAGEPQSGFPGRSVRSQPSSSGITPTVLSLTYTATAGESYETSSGFLECSPGPCCLTRDSCVLGSLTDSHVHQVKLASGGPEQVSHPTLLETVGPSIFVPLLIPVALTALPLLTRGRARTPVSVATTFALVVFVVIGSASIGWFHVPALAAAVAAVVASMGSHARLQVRPN